ncbi:TetR/AcrR family transcriptional regulator [Streptomyces sparsogenes]|uniref:TetR/AcrR family transcriptional regulator n=1 Tax=Streptomyces sparsogenes TaxID=67365 RepID=UPI003D9EDE94
MTSSAPPQPPSHPASSPRGEDEGAARRSLLPLAGQAPPMRADAARNRARLLEAAARLVAERGVDKLTMEAVACAASVGKGTVFRRFGDRTGLLQALLDHSEQAYQQAFLTGPPPLGPGAPAVERLAAFGVATLRQMCAYLDLYLAGDPPADRRLSSAPRQVRLTHITMLLREAGGGGDTELRAETLMGYLEPALIHHLTRQRGMPLDRLEEGWRDLVARVTGPAMGPAVSPAVESAI